MQRAGRSHRPDRRRAEMTVAEASAIIAQAESGTLSTDDPDVRRIVGQARRVLVRADTWGVERSPRSRRNRRFLVVGSIGFLVVWIVGLLWPLLALVGD